ncbi:MAG: flavin monoamine oxidase family protein [Dehalococcoidia bacterium]
MSQSLDCIVIGAGPAGLMAGVTLREAGRNILVLEARDHIGGRAHSGGLSDGTPVERGAELVHGATIATWELLIRFGLTTHFVPMRERGRRAVFQNGEWEFDTDPEIDHAYEQLEEALGRPDGDRISLHQALIDYGFNDIQVEDIKSTMRIMSPIDPEKVSTNAALHAWRLVSPKSLNFAIVEGYSQLWKNLSDPINDVIRLSTPANAIEWSPDRVLAHAGDQVFDARTAILTVSLGVLQANAIEFTPTLPERKLAAIQGLRMGPLIKVIAEFHRPFWEDQLGQVSSFRHSNSLFSSFDSHFWDRPGPPTLVVFLGAGPAKEVSGDSDKIRSMLLRDLGEMFPEVDLEAELVSLDIVDWAADPWARGGVSVGPVGGKGLRGDLAAPTPSLFWAGEATAEGGSAECVHGALETGRRAAVEALHALQPLYVGNPEARLDWREYTPRMR